MSRYQIAKETGVDAAVLHRIVKGSSGCNMETLETLCYFLGLELKARESGKRKGKGR